MESFNNKKYRMKPTDNQKKFLAEVAKTIDFLQNTNDLSSPTHHSDLNERASQICSEFGVSNTMLCVAFDDILQLARRVK